MTKTPARPEVSTLHGILTRLEWVKKEYLELPSDLRATLEEGTEMEEKYLPKLASLIIATEEMVNAAEAMQPKAEEYYQPTEDELKRYAKAVDKIARANLQNLTLEHKAALKSTTGFKKKLELLEEVAETY